MLPVAAPVRVAALLARLPDQDAEVVHHSAAAAYLAVHDAGGDRRVLGVTAPGAVGVPCALRAACPLPAPGAADPRVRGGRLHLAGEPLVVRRLVDCRVPRLRPGLRWLERAARGPAVDRPGADWPDPDGPGAAERLVGRGPGLTPLGDDLLAGWLVAHRAAGVPTPGLDAALPGLLPRTTEVSAALLRCALDGEAADPVRAHLAALGTDREPATRVALLAVGHTSGTGIAAGLHRALRRIAGAGGRGGRAA